MGVPHSKAFAVNLLKNMKVVAAYMLASVGGNAKPSVADVTKILSSVGIELDADCSKQLEELVEEMSGKDLAETLAAGHEKLKAVPMGGGGGGDGGGDGGAAEAKKESSEEEEEMAP